MKRLLASIIALSSLPLQGQVQITGPAVIGGSSSAGGIPPHNVNFLGTTPDGFFTVAPYQPVNINGDTMLGPLFSPEIGGDFYPSTALVNNGSVCADVVGTNCTYTGTDQTALLEDPILRACSFGGGRVHYPAGIYNATISPGVPRITGGVPTHVSALYIPCDNITLEGAGIGSTIISIWQKNADGSITQPTAECPSFNTDFVPGVNDVVYRIWRGSGIFITGGLTPSAPRHNVTIKDMRITGNSSIINWSRNPVSWDQNLSLGISSVCNAWDTSNKGIYLQNNVFAANPTGPAFYDGTKFYYDNIHIDTVQLDHFLGELIYNGDIGVSNSSITNNTLIYSNGDATSVGGGWDIINNDEHDLAGQGNEDTPDTINGYNLRYINNKIKNVQNAAIALGNNSVPPPNAKIGQVLIQGVQIDNAHNNGISLSSIVNAKVQGNQINNSGWNLPYVSSAIQNATILGTQNYSAGPTGPTSTTASAGTGGSLASGNYTVCAAWSFNTTYSWGYTTCTLTTVNVSSSSGTITVNAPSSPPVSATGWIPFACLQVSGSCTATPQLTAVGSFYNPVPLGTSSVVISALGTITSATANTKDNQSFFPLNQNVDISSNYITADTGSTWSGIYQNGFNYGLLPYTYSSISVHDNTIQNSGRFIAAPVADPTAAAVLTQVANNTGQPTAYTAYYPQFTPGTILYAVYTLVTPECETKATTSVASITMGSSGSLSNIFEMQPPTGAPSNAVGFRPYVGTSPSGPFYSQSVAGWNNFSAPYIMSAPLKTTGTTPPTSSCGGVIMNHAIDTPPELLATSGYTEVSNIPIRVVGAYNGGTTFSAAKLKDYSLNNTSSVICGDSNNGFTPCTTGGGFNLTVASTTLTSVTAPSSNSNLYIPTTNNSHITMYATIRTTTAGTAGTASISVTCGAYSNASNTINLATLNSVQTISQRATWNTGDGNCGYAITVTGNSGGVAQASVWFVLN